MKYIKIFEDYNIGNNIEEVSFEDFEIFIDTHLHVKLSKKDTDIINKFEIIKSYSNNEGDFNVDVIYYNIHLYQAEILLKYERKYFQKMINIHITKREDEWYCMRIYDVDNKFHGYIIDGLDGLKMMINSIIENFVHEIY